MFKKLLIGLMVIFAGMLAVNLALHAATAPAPSETVGDDGGGDDPAPQGTASVSFTYDFSRRGWHMFSIPLQNADLGFMGRNSSWEYEYVYTLSAGRTCLDGSRNAPCYAQVTALYPAGVGKGYWGKWAGSNPTSATITGDAIPQLVITRGPGWQMIGSLDLNAAVNNIACLDNIGNPVSCDDILHKTFFHYDAAGYAATNTILAGKGHWVKFKQAGSIVLTRPPISAVPEGWQPFNAAQLNKITLSDNTNKTVNLWFGSKAVNVELPTPQEGGYDVRFADGKLVKNTPSGARHLVEVNNATYPIKLSWDIKDPAFKTYVAYGTVRPLLLTGVGSLTINSVIPGDTLYVYTSYPSTGCFLSGTPITMSNGKTKAIEQVRVGDMILAFDEASKTLKPDKVKEFFEHEADEYLVVNGRLKLTDNHPVNSGGKWVEIGTLKVGDSLLNSQGKQEKIASIQKINQKVKVYNLEVNPYHTYIAGGIVVHNKIAPSDSNVKIAN